MSRFQRTISRERIAKCPFSVAQSYVCAFLSDAKQDGCRGLVRASIGPLRIAAPISADYGLRWDSQEQGRPHDEIAFSWNAAHPLLPGFQGVIRLRIRALCTLVRIEGSYRPPLGVAGVAFDALAGCHIARRTLDDLLVRLCEELERRETLWSNALLDASGPAVTEAKA